MLRFPRLAACALVLALGLALGHGEIRLSAQTLDDAESSFGNVGGTPPKTNFSTGIQMEMDLLGAPEEENLEGESQASVELCCEMPEEERAENAMCRQVECPKAE